MFEIWDFVIDSLKKLVYICLQITNFTSQERLFLVISTTMEYSNEKKELGVKNSFCNTTTNTSPRLSSQQLNSVLLKLLHIEPTFEDIQSVEELEAVIDSW